jgi:hypothetical protein
VRKFALAVVLLFTACAAFADLNIKFGLDPFGEVRQVKRQNGITTLNPDFGVSLKGDYLRLVRQDVKAGLGLEYLFPRNMGKDTDFSYMPLYITAECTPFYEKEIFFKVNLGYNLLFNTNNSDIKNGIGGFYYAFGAGFEYDYGMTVALMFSSYYANTSSADYIYNKIGIDIGYKFNI